MPTHPPNALTNVAPTDRQPIGARSGHLGVEPQRSFNPTQNFSRISFKKKNTAFRNVSFLFPQKNSSLLAFSCVVWRCFARLKPLLALHFGNRNDLRSSSCLSRVLWSSLQFSISITPFRIIPKLKKRINNQNAFLNKVHKRRAHGTYKGTTLITHTQQAAERNHSKAADRLNSQ